MAIAGSMALALACTPALAEQSVIASFHDNGQLTWTNQPGTNGFAVQWAPAAAGPWSSNWQALDALITTGAQTTVSVPMVYRVAQGFSLASMRGAWLVVTPTRGNPFFIAQEDGIISESGMFILRGPAGFFTVDGSGNVTNTFANWDGSTVVSGRFAGPNQVLLDPPLTNALMRRVENVARCAGAWTGTLSQTAGSGTPTSYPVTFNVDSRGLVTGLTGFSGNNIGRLFALSDGTVGGFFFTGDETYAPYHQIRLSGTLSGHSILGTYLVDDDGSIQGSIALTRP